MTEPANTDGYFEASAGSRSFARTLRDMFVAFTAEGFDRNEALFLIGQVIQANSPKGGS